MIRITLLTFLIAYLSVYAWKDWFRAACWLVLLMAVFQHPDMPKSVGGVPGLNHWNFLFLNVVCSWWINRRKEQLTWDMPKHLSVLLFFYALFIILSVIRYFISDLTGFIELNDLFGWQIPGGISATNEYLINCFKWVFPGMIIFDGCRKREQYNYALIMLLLLFFLLALQVIKAMKLGSLAMDGEYLQRKALKVISSNVGYHRVNISMMMSGAFWAVFCAKEYVNRKVFYFIIIPVCMSILLAMGMTGGRTGYVTWVIVGGIFCLFKWRKYLLLAPVLLTGLVIVAPAAIDRLLQGVVQQEEPEVVTHVEVNFNQDELDQRLITSGRIIAWPLVLDSIYERPLMGYGREAMKNAGVTLEIIQKHGRGEYFPHPHNAYLQWIQDNGLLGAIPVFLFYFFIVKYSWSLFRETDVRIYTVTGGVCFALVSAFLIASSGSQTFYPREGAVAMWVGIALMLRVFVERNKVKNGQISLLITPKELSFGRLLSKI